MPGFFRCRHVAAGLAWAGLAMIITAGVVMGVNEPDCLKQSKDHVNSDCSPMWTLGAVGCVVLVIGTLSWMKLCLTDQSEESAPLRI